MKEKDLLKAMTDINPEFVLEAAPDHDEGAAIPLGRRRIFRVLSASAAACLLLAAGLGIAGLRHGAGKNDAGPAMMEEAGEAFDAYEEAEEAFDAYEKAAPENSIGMTPAAGAAVFETEEETSEGDLSETESETGPEESIER